MLSSWDYWFVGNSSTLKPFFANTLANHPKFSHSGTCCLIALCFGSEFSGYWKNLRFSAWERRNTTGMSFTCKVKSLEMMLTTVFSEIFVLVSVFIILEKCRGHLSNDSNKPQLWCRPFWIHEVGGPFFLQAWEFPAERVIGTETVEVCSV